VGVVDAVVLAGAVGAGLVEAVVLGGEVGGGPVVVVEEMVVVGPAVVVDSRALVDVVVGAGAVVLWADSTWTAIASLVGDCAK
jgi:UDP-3-O-[3-hydroxymyristoyl] glucosamine N-acyltransferase